MSSRAEVEARCVRRSVSRFVVVVVVVVVVVEGGSDEEEVEVVGLSLVAVAVVVGEGIFSCFLGRLGGGRVMYYVGGWLVGWYSVVGVRF